MGPTWREFEDFRLEARKRLDDVRDESRRKYGELEQKVWGLVAALFLVVAGDLFSRFFMGAPAATTAGAFVLFVIRHIG